MSMNHVADDAVEKVEQRNEVPQGVHGDGDIHWDDKVSRYVFSRFYCFLFHFIDVSQLPLQGQYRHSVQ